MTGKRIQWHRVLQDILDRHLETMSGKRMVAAEREVSRSFKVDYYCRVDPGAVPQNRVAGILPFDHLLEHNVFEYKSIHQSLDETTLREYIGRALLFEARLPRGSRLTLNILVTRLPVKVLGRGYGFREIAPWKYVAFCLDLPIYLLVQNRMRRVLGGEPLAYLQALEGNPFYRKETWTAILEQELPGREFVKYIMKRLDAEVVVSYLDEVRREGRLQGKREGLREGKQSGKIEGKLEGKLDTLLAFLDIRPGLKEQYEQLLHGASSLEELLSIESRLKTDLSRP